jgi:hypothetical protein
MYIYIGVYEIVAEVEKQMNIFWKFGLVGWRVIMRIESGRNSTSRHIWEKKKG